MIEEMGVKDSKITMLQNLNSELQKELFTFKTEHERVKNQLCQAEKKIFENQEK